MIVQDMRTPIAFTILPPGRCPACGEWNTMVEEPKAARPGYSSIYVSSYNLSEDFRRPEGIRIVEMADIPALYRDLFRE